jgi:hypothetical protein
MTPISKVTSITLPIISFIISYIAILLNFSPIYAQTLLLFYILGIISGVIFREKPPFFQITEETLNRCAKSGIPQEIIVQLRELKNKIYGTKEEFIDVIKSKVGDENATNYEVFLLKNATIDKSKLTVDRKFIGFILSIVVSIGIIAVILIFLVKPDIKITYPKDGGTIDDGRSKVTGIAKRLKDNKVRLVVYYVGRRTFYPQREVNVNEKGEWEGEVLLTSGSTEYFIWAIIVNDNQDKWLKDNDEFTEWGFKPKFFHKVNVYRK